ncbi:MAG: glycosyltransferase [Cyanobacteria bacterium P01_H01_bin.15]
MIVITLGTSPFPFTRVTEWLSKLLFQNLINEPVLFQHGSTPLNGFQHPLVTSVKSIELRELRQTVQSANLTISHAGQGSTRMLIELEAPFVLLPRLQRYREHIDDHQLQFAQAISRYGICFTLDYHSLAAFCRHKPFPVARAFFEAPKLADYLSTTYAGPQSSENTWANFSVPQQNFNT